MLEKLHRARAGGRRKRADHLEGVGGGLEVGKGASEEAEDRTVGGEEGLCADRAFDDGWEWLVGHDGGAGEECEEKGEEANEQNEEGRCSGSLIRCDGGC